MRYGARMITTPKERSRGRVKGVNRTPEERHHGRIDVPACARLGGWHSDDEQPGFETRFSGSGCCQVDFVAGG